MTWLDRELKIVAAGNFVACHTAQEAGLIPPGRISVQVTGSLLRLTCACGSVCMLAYKEETMAALWGLRCLTDQIDGVLGAIQQGSLTMLQMPYFPITEATPERRDLLRAMKRAARGVTYRGTSSSTRTTKASRSTGGQPNVSRETEEM